MWVENDSGLWNKKQKLYDSKNHNRRKTQIIRAFYIEALVKKETYMYLLFVFVHILFMQISFHGILLVEII